MYSSSRYDKKREREPTTGMVRSSSAVIVDSFSISRCSARSSSVSASPYLFSGG